MNHPVVQFAITKHHSEFTSFGPKTLLLNKIEGSYAVSQSEVVSNFFYVIASRSCAPLDPLIRPRRTLRSLPARLPPRNWTLTNGLHDLGPKKLLTCSYAPFSFLTWLRFKGLKGSQVLIFPRASGIQGIKGFRVYRYISLVYPQGIKGTIFSLSVLDYAQRYYACA